MQDEKGGGMNEGKLGKLRELDVMLQKMSAEHHKLKKKPAPPVEEQDEEAPDHEALESAPEEQAEQPEPEEQEEDDGPLADMIAKPKKERSIIIDAREKPGKKLPPHLMHGHKK